MANVTMTKSGNPVMFKSIDEAPIWVLEAHFLPVQAGSGDPSPTNVRPITGWTGVEYIQCGQADNLLAPSAYTVDTNYGGIHIQILENGKHIKLYGTCNTNNALVAGYVYTDEPCYCYGVPVSSFPVWKTNDGELYSDINGVELYPDENGKITFQIQFVSGMQYDFDFYPIFTDKPKTPVNWETEAGTVYGGFVSIRSQVAYVNKYYKCVNLGDYNWLKGGDNIYYTDSFEDDVSKTGYIYCSHYKPFWGSSAPGNNNLHCFQRSNGSFRIIITDEAKNMTVEQFKEAMNGVQFFYKMTTITTVASLPRTPLYTVAGQNVIASNTNGDCFVEYDLHEAGDIAAIRRRVNQGAPHLVTSTPADIATFNTDLAAPVKELRCEFMPVQEGSGDPSPENVRAISGWTGVDVTRCGKNLFNVSVPQSFPSDTTGSSTTKRIFKPNTYIIGTSGTNYYSPNSAQCTINNDILTINTKSGYGIGFAFSLKKATTYNIKFVPDNEHVNVGVSSYSADGTFTKIAEGVPYNNFPWSFNTRADTDIILLTFKNHPGDYYNIDINISNIQLIEGNIDSTYEPYTGTTTPISWQSEAGTVYGGYVDLVKGEVVATWAEKTLTQNDTYTIDTWPERNRVAWYDYMTLGKLNGTFVCDRLKTIENGQGATGDDVWEIYGSVVAPRCWITVPTSISSKDDFKAWVAENPVKIIYELATPIHTPITPTTLNTLKGANNVWSSANGPVTVKYWKH